MIDGRRSVGSDHSGSRKSAGRWLREGLYAGGFVLLLVALLPLLGVALFITRAALVAFAAVAAAGAVVAFAVSPRVRRWLEGEAQGVMAYKGLQLATDVSLAGDHVWARREGRNAFLGVDDLAQSALGPVEAAELPQVGSQVRRGDLLFRLRRGRRVLSGRSPVSGAVVGVNRNLESHPSTINDSPYGAGWLVRMEGEEVRGDARSLLRGSRAQEWFRHEVDRLVSTLGAEEAVTTLPDGGLVVEQLHGCLDDEDWERLRASFFEAGLTSTPA